MPFSPSSEGETKAREGQPSGMLRAWYQSRKPIHMHLKLSAKFPRLISIVVTATEALSMDFVSGCWRKSNTYVHRSLASFQLPKQKTTAGDEADLFHLFHPSLSCILSSLV